LRILGKLLFISLAITSAISACIVFLASYLRTCLRKRKRRRRVQEGAMEASKSARDHARSEISASIAGLGHYLKHIDASCSQRGSRSAASQTLVSIESATYLQTQPIPRYTGGARILACSHAPGSPCNMRS
jgi:hypothetical protein